MRNVPPSALDLAEFYDIELIELRRDLTEEMLSRGKEGSPSFPLKLAFDFDVKQKPVHQSAPLSNCKVSDLPKVRKGRKMFPCLSIPSGDEGYGRVTSRRSGPKTLPCLLLPL